MINVTRIQEIFFYHEDGFLCFKKNSGRNGRFKAGSRAGCTDKNSGARITYLDGKYYQEHILIWTLLKGNPPTNVIRHTDGNLGNNKITNLYEESPLRNKRVSRLTIKRIKEVLNYSPETGVLTWKVSPRNRTRVGDIAGTLNESGYLFVCIDGLKIRAHRAAWGIYYGNLPEGFIDHINGVRDDNRICNLRLATKSLNSQNSFIRNDNKTGVKGVHFRKDTEKFSASIQIDGKTYYLGCYSCLEDARAARLLAEKKFHLYRKKYE